MASILERLSRTFFEEPNLHPTESKMAKHWIRQRLIALFPHLAKDPAKLEAAYRSLNLTPAGNAALGENGQTVPVFEITSPDSNPT